MVTRRHCIALLLVLLLTGCGMRRLAQPPEAHESLRTLEQALAHDPALAALRTQGMRPGEQEFRLWMFVSSAWIHGVALREDRQGWQVRRIKVDMCTPSLREAVASRPRVAQREAERLGFAGCEAAQRRPAGRALDALTQYRIRVDQAERRPGLGALWQAIESELVSSLWAPDSCLDQEPPAALCTLVNSEVLIVLEWRKGEQYRVTSPAEGDNAEAFAQVQKILLALKRELGGPPWTTW